jgi:hypothetical protein
MSNTDTEESRVAFSQARMEEIGETYNPRIKTFLREVRDVARERGYTCADEPYDMTDETFTFGLDLKPPGMDPDADGGVDVNIKIPESYVYGDASPDCEDKDSNRNGVNFMLDLTEWGGRILGGFAPFNYTSDCWVDISDAEAVETRWAIFDSALDAEAIVDAIEEFYAEKAA